MYIIYLQILKHFPKWKLYHHDCMSTLSVLEKYFLQIEGMLLMSFIIKGVAEIVTYNMFNFETINT